MPTQKTGHSLDFRVATIARTRPLCQCPKRHSYGPSWSSTEPENKQNRRSVGHATRNPKLHQPNVPTTIELGLKDSSYLFWTGLFVPVKTPREIVNRLHEESRKAVQVPAVMGSTESVFASDPARHWLRLLEALEQPASRPRAVAVAFTPFVGMTARDVAGADEARWEDLHARLHHWADVLRRQGVAAWARAIFTAEGRPGRVLSDETGERELTDLGHVAQLLHAGGAAAQRGPPALRAWRARRSEESDSETADAEDRSRRLDSDAEAVQVLTIHRAKGLECPIVYCPYLWDAGQTPRMGQPVVFPLFTSTVRGDDRPGDFTASIQWGDGHTSAGVVSASGASTTHQALPSVTL